MLAMILPSAARLFLVAAFSELFVGARAYGEPAKYLIATAPSSSRIAYIKLPDKGRPLEPGDNFRTLVETNLVVPHGIAVDEYRKKLYVGDPGLGKVVAYDLKHDGDALKVGDRHTIAEDVEVRWLAVDGIGNVFFTDEPRSRILRVSAQQIEEGNKTAEVLYDSAWTDKVSAPGGIITDNFFVYWVNKASGTQKGSLMRAPSSQYLANSSTNIQTFSNNAMKCYGVCMALNNIFYTDEVVNVYGLKRSGTGLETVSESLEEPRGCVHDGDSTVYIADKASHTLYQFASNMQEVKPNQVFKKAGDFEGIYGLAMYMRV